MDAYDRERAHKQAREVSSDLYDQHYGGQYQYNPGSEPPRALNYDGQWGNDQGYYNN